MNPRKVCLILTIQSFCDPQLESVVHFVFSGYVLLLQIPKYVTAHDEFTRSLSHAHISITSDKCWGEVWARVQSWAEQTNF